jgi:hypothetical protein
MLVGKDDLSLIALQRAALTKAIDVIQQDLLPGQRPGSADNAP